MDPALRVWLVVISLCVACGDPPLVRSHDLVIVAHQDDDLLFMQPDLHDVVAAHRPATIVYVTAGDGGNGLTYADSRVTATKAAYGWVAGSQAWQCTWLAIAGHQARRCELPDQHVTLLYLGYPDGEIGGDAPTSLLHLWQGDIASAQTVADHVTTYDRAGLIATIATIIATTQPTIIRTLEVSATHGYDHSDHMIVGALAVLAAATSHTSAAFVSYRGYNAAGEPTNNDGALFDEISLGMRAYEACQIGCAVCGPETCPTVSNGWYNQMLHRRYAIAMRPPPMSGLLQVGGRCLAVRGSKVRLDSCAFGTEVRFERNGQIRAGGYCLQVLPSGELGASACDRAGPEDFFLFDEEGHLWSGVAPPPGPNMYADHTMCVTADTTVHVAVCGSMLETRWVLGRAPAVVSRAELGLTARGRGIALADVTGDGKADLCWIAGGLWCAAGDGTGRFAAAVRIDAPEAPLAIEPRSLMLGDLDGDGRIDACGRTSSGIMCALAADGYAAALWSPGFARTGTPPPGDQALAIADHQICGTIDGGMACASPGGMPVTRSSWPSAGAALWSADLDGDGVADWCVATQNGPACSLDADLRVTADGVPWGFSFLGKVDDSAASDGTISDQAHGAIADVSGDGRADLCVATGNGVECALSQGHGFGPRFPVLTLPAASTAVALWLGDLDGDGKADPCVDDGTTITCALSP
ncbi:MAG TPA: FG-GAP-like repeat-containing protein [Kofleriaceae bacterium]|nr:FG-GAP-like repeat-containing protein [Kofleriaceae bacterium]